MGKASEGGHDGRQMLSRAGDVLRDSIETHSKSISALLVVAVLIPAIVVAAQFSSEKSILPVAHDFPMIDSETGTRFRLSDHLGNVVFLELMFTRCPACIASMPDLTALRNHYEGKPLVMLSVTIDGRDSTTDMQEFKETYAANWTFAVPENRWGVRQSFDVDATPTYIILDRGGRITYRAVGRMGIDVLEHHIDETLSS